MFLRKTLLDVRGLLRTHHVRQGYLYQDHLLQAFLAFALVSTPNLPILVRFFSRLSFVTVSVLVHDLLYFPLHIDAAQRLLAAVGGNPQEGDKIMSTLCRCLLLVLEFQKLFATLFHHWPTLSTMGTFHSFVTLILPFRQG